EHPHRAGLPGERPGNGPSEAADGAREREIVDRGVLIRREHPLLRGATVRPVGRRGGHVGRGRLAQEDPVPDETLVGAVPDRRVVVAVHRGEGRVGRLDRARLGDGAEAERQDPSLNITPRLLAEMRNTQPTCPVNCERYWTPNSERYVAVKVRALKPVLLIVYCSAQTRPGIGTLAASRTVTDQAATLSESSTYRTSQTPLIGAVPA